LNAESIRCSCFAIVEVPLAAAKTMGLLLHIHMSALLLAIYSHGVGRVRLVLPLYSLQDPLGHDVLQAVGQRSDLLTARLLVDHCCCVSVPLSRPLPD